MPMRSQAQRAYLHIHEPAVAERFERETPKGKLPYKVGKKKRRRKFRSKDDVERHLGRLL